VSSGRCLERPRRDTAQDRPRTRIGAREERGGGREGLGPAPGQTPRAACADHDALGVPEPALRFGESQHYDSASGTEQGSKGYAGATPSWVIWQLLTRYTREGDTVLDPMCGSGTTLDVCRDTGREGIGLDLNPQRPEITRADAREIPLGDESVDFVFVDPPYSTHIEYSDDGRCIGKLDASAPPVREGEVMGQAYYAAMDAVIGEIVRVLRPNRYMGLYVSDSWKKRRGVKGGVFMPIGFELFGILAHCLRPVDIVCVVRRNAKLSRGNWHKAAREENFFLRGFNYLFIMKKDGRSA